MSYLVYDKNGELIDVLEFETSEQLKLYKLANPSHDVEFTSDLEDKFLIEDDLDDEYTVNYEEGITPRW